jgi:2-acylglycerol O-acyltransferase 2
MFAFLATGMTTLNGVKKVCGPMPRLLDFQRRGYRSYHKRSELCGDLHTIQHGRSFFACHPHGMLSVGWISNVVWGRKFHELTGRCFYLIDNTLRNKGLFARVFCDAFEGPHGGLRDNRRHTIEQLMERGESVCMTPGAFQEATLMQTGKDRVVLQQRKGFVKFCLRHGYRLHPVYTFGESDTYRTIGGFEKVRLRLNKIGIPTVAFWGLPWFPLAPRTDLDMLTYVGAPVELPKIDAPSIEEVDEWHGKYVAALQDVFNKFKAEAGRPEATLEVL